MELLRRLFDKREEEKLPELPRMDKREDIDRRVLWFFTDTNAVYSFGPDGRRLEIDRSEIVYEFPRVTVAFKEQEVVERQQDSTS